MKLTIAQVKSIFTRAAFKDASRRSTFENLLHALVCSQRSQEPSALIAGRSSDQVIESYADQIAADAAELGQITDEELETLRAICAAAKTQQFGIDVDENGVETLESMGLE